jgi:disulfide bond formation protein DsbB
MKKKMQYALPYIPYITFVIALASTLISLYFSEIMKLPACVLCWYQRICMYPLVFISAVSIYRKQKDLHTYVLPFTLLGLLIAIYHNLIYFHIIPEVITSCTNGVSCTAKQIEFFGFITIPFMSMVTFAFLTAVMLLYSKFSQRKQEKEEKNHVK